MTEYKDFASLKAMLLALHPNARLARAKASFALLQRFYAEKGESFTLHLLSEAEFNALPHPSHFDKNAPSLLTPRGLLLIRRPQTHTLLDPQLAGSVAMALLAAAWQSLGVFETPDTVPPGKSMLDAEIKANLALVNTAMLGVAMQCEKLSVESDRRITRYPPLTRLLLQTLRRTQLMPEDIVAESAPLHAFDPGRFQTVFDAVHRKAYDLLKDYPGEHHKAGLLADIGREDPALFAQLDIKKNFANSYFHKVFTYPPPYPDYDITLSEHAALLVDRLAVTPHTPRRGPTDGHGGPSLH